MPDNSALGIVPVIYQQDVRAAARQYGVPESALARLLDIESDHFAPDVISGKRKSSAGAIGMAQFMPRTAQDQGIDPTDPIASIYGAAKLLQQYGGGNPNKPVPLTPDQLKVAVASYVSGPGTVQKAMASVATSSNSQNFQQRAAGDRGETDWTKVWPSLTNDPKGTADYLARITSDVPSTSDRSASAGATSTSAGGFQEPQLKDFELIDPQTGQGTGRYDSAAYNRAMAEFRQFQNGQYSQQPKGNDFASFMDTVVSQMGQQIQAGQLDVTKANGEFNRRMSAYDSASKNWNANLGYGIPNGATTIPGTDINIEGKTVDYNPFQEALALVNSTPDLTKIPTPQVPSVGNMFQSALDLYGRAAGAGVTTPPNTFATPGGWSASGGNTQTPVTPGAPTSGTDTQSLARRFLQQAEPSGDYWR